MSCQCNPVEHCHTNCAPLIVQIPGIQGTGIVWENCSEEEKAEITKLLFKPIEEQTNATLAKAKDYADKVEAIGTNIEKYSWDIPHIVNSLEEVEQYDYDGYFWVRGFGDAGINGEDISNRLVGEHTLKELFDNIQDTFETLVPDAYSDLAENYLFQALIATAVNTRNYTKIDLLKFDNWFKEGLGQLKYLQDISKQAQQSTKTKTELFNQWALNGLNKLQTLSDLSNTSSQFTNQFLNNFFLWFSSGKNEINSLYTGCIDMTKKVNLLIDNFDQDIQFRKLQLRTEATKPYLLWIVAGQSNAKGTLNGKKGTESASHCALYWDWRKQDAKSLKPLVDPVYACTTGSAWPAFARTIYALTGRKSIVLNVAYGGAAVTAPSSNTWYGDNSEKRIVAAREYNALIQELKAKNINYELAGILWIQGEAEGGLLYRKQVTVDDYVKGTQDVFKYLRNLTEKQTLPVYISVIGDYKKATTIPEYQAAWEQIQQAQRNLPKLDNTIHVAYNGAHGFIKAGLMNDDIHYSQEGYNLVGQGMARYISNNI